MKPLYHGTIYDFEEIDVSAGKGYKDFGKGFYATAVPSHAENLPKQYFFRTPEAVNTLSFDKVKRQVIG